MNYYEKKQLLAQVDENDNVIGRVDKWEAHEKGILHRGFTTCLFYKDGVILQHRKHPVFDGVFDLTGSSHPYLEGEKLQEIEKAVIMMLNREWGLTQANLSSPLVHEGSVYYKAADPLSKYTEHEICHLYTATISVLPSPNYDFAYGFSIFPKNHITQKNQSITNSFAPWVNPLLKLL